MGIGRDGKFIGHASDCKGWSLTVGQQTFARVSNLTGLERVFSDPITGLGST